MDERALLRPYSWINAEPALRVVSGSGSHVIDDKGARYFDAAGGLWNLPFGLGNPALCEAASHQLSVCSFASLFDDLTHGNAEVLATTLAKMLGGHGRQVYLSTTGSSAVEAAIWLARAYFKALNR